MRRFAMLALSLSLLLGLTASRLVAQDKPKDDAKAAVPAKPDDKKADDKKADDKKADDKKADDKKADDKKADDKKADDKKAGEKKAEPEVPKEVREKLEAARKAVAEAIAAAEAAGLVETSIEPPPVLDILIDGRATDARTLKELAGLKDKSGKGVSPEVFAAWFTGYGKKDFGINYEEDVRIVNPSQGLQDYYDRRAAVLKPYLDEARKARGLAATPKAEAKKDEAKKDEAKKDEKKDEAKKDEPKKDEAKKDESKAAEKKDEAKKDETKPAEKKDETKKDETKAEDKAAEKKDGLSR